MRIDKPVGTLLLLWPTLAALCLAADGLPPLHLIVVFTVGTFLMRSAGCVINEDFDRNLDGGVSRTAERPLARGALTPKFALGLFAALLVAAATLLIFLNPFAQVLAFGGVLIATAYPLMKRVTYLPQVVLGAAFSWGMVMAFAAVQGELPRHAWLLFFGSTLWIVAYDTLYAMVDRDDDLVMGIRSTAILFGSYDRAIVGAMQASAAVCFALYGIQDERGWAFFVGVAAMLATFAYQQMIIRGRQRDACFAAFRNNVWSGFLLLVGTIADLLRFA